VNQEMRPRSRGFLLGILMACAVSLAGFGSGCAGEGQETATTTANSVADVTSVSKSVTFTTDDGVTLGGHLFGSGGSGVVLAHMYPADQRSWYPTAQQLAADGYLVLTFDFRGYPESEGSKDVEFIDKDVTAAIGAIAEAGAAEAALIGASMGGTACLAAAAETSLPIPVTGVATLSAPVEFMGLSAAEAVPQLTIPLLFIAAEDDVGADGARRLQQLAAGKGDLELFPGNQHGTQLLEGPYAEEVGGLLTGFLQGLAP
jgi:pimeloyl-ACP methyl ester carboxylesterase